MKILVTGGAGYIGTALVDALARREDVSEVVVYDNLSRSNPNLFISESMPSDSIRFIRGDILDTRRLARELEGVDLVYHLAARVSTPFADADFHGLDQVNHWGCAELSYLLETHPVGRVVYLSSTSVYGASEESVGLETPPQPRTAYGISKFRGEQMLTRDIRELLTGAEWAAALERCSLIFLSCSRRTVSSVFFSFRFCVSSLLTLSLPS